jgi:hypothetical protein
LLYKQKLEAERVESAAMRFGSAVDCLLTEPHKFNTDYFVSAHEPPSETIQKIIKHVVDIHPEYTKLFNIAHVVLEGCKREQYGNAWKDETRVKKVIEQGEMYHQELFDSEGKILLSLAEYGAIENVVGTLKYNRFTQFFFNPTTDPFYDPTRYEFLWQTPIIFTVNNVKCKALIDLVLVDHQEKTIYVYDIKTTGGTVYAFPSSYIKFGYGLQGAFYHRAIVEETKTKPEWSEYTVVNTAFIVAEQANVNPPIIYEMTTQDIMVGRHMGVLPSGREVKGYEPLIAELAWHEKTSTWDYPMKIAKEEGRVKLDLFKVEPKVMAIN